MGPRAGGQARQGGQVSQGTSQALADDFSNPKLPFTMAGEADQNPRVPRRRERTGLRQSPEGMNQVDGLGLPEMDESREKRSEIGVHQIKSSGMHAPAGERSPGRQLWRCSLTAGRSGRVPFSF